MSVPLLDDEKARLEVLLSYDILDTTAEQAYDDITYLASMITGMPIALVSLVDQDRQWFKSKVGLEATETPRDVAFCDQTIREPGGLLVVPDAHRDSRFASSPLVTGEPQIRFYAGAALVAPGGERLGALCVIDRVSRELAPEQIEALGALARQVMAQLNLRRAVARLEEIDAQRARYQRSLELSHRGLTDANSRLKVESLTDTLTGLPNRRAFEQTLANEIERSRRHKRTLSLLLVDVDHFKRYNDTYGHVDGDIALRNVAGCIRQATRKHDLPARYGGEEFAVILPDTKTAGAAIIAERIRKNVEATSSSGQPVTVSIGVASLHGEAVDAEELVRRADEALYAAKSRGRNQVWRHGWSTAGAAGPGDRASVLGWRAGGRKARAGGIEVVGGPTGRAGGLPSLAVTTRSSGRSGKTELASAGSHA